ncbi:hypothetical protein IEQ34_000938 [Dendrobium chrysotoxum]|uniref:NB-ARC domain-containing protein n=1 Tax=Dendrobium chrysotoxum TaxID=161865 RepID=A0AAV7H5E6_DENCH|nr:hypothetical protein IEQ34_000938 [Dendrobium chrysotoxum]
MPKRGCFPFPNNNPPQTSSLINDPLVVGREVDVAANELANLLIFEKVEEKCRVFAITGMKGIGKTTLAQKIFYHHEIENYFNVKAWACVTQTYSEIELLKLIIRAAKGSHGNTKKKIELQNILSNCFTSGQRVFLVLEDVRRADVWNDLLRVPLHHANISVRVLVTTRYEDVANDMEVAYTHQVKELSIESSWDMLCRFLDKEKELAYGSLKELGVKILERCRGHPHAIKSMARVLKKIFTWEEWQNVLLDDTWSISSLLESDP